MGYKYDNRKKQNYKGNGKKKNAPQMDRFMESLKDEIFRQMEEFKVAHESLENMDSNTRVAVENELFLFPAFPTTMNAPIPEDSDDKGEDWSNLKIYCVNRRVITNRETHKLVMATCSAVVLLAGAPKYFMVATMYPDYTGTLTINKIGLNGVESTAFLRFGNRKVTEHESSERE